MTGQNATEQDGKPKTAKKSRWRFVWWALLWLLLGLMLCAALVWNKRYNLAEWQVRKEFAKAGITAQLEIDYINKQEAAITNISLSMDGEEFFRASGATLQYDYKQLRSGQLQRVVIKEPSLHITLDAAGTITNNWMPKPSDKPLIFPKNGLVIEDASLGWKAPFGHGTALINTDIRSASDWTLMLDSKDSVLTDENVSVSLKYQGVVEQKTEDRFSAIGSLSTLSLDTEVLQTGAVKAGFNMVFSRGETPQFVDAKGWLNLIGADIQSENYGLDRAAVKFDLETQFDMQAKSFMRFKTDWDMNSQGIAFKNKQARSELSRVLSASDALENAPLVGAFAPYFPDTIDTVLQKFSLGGQGQFALSPTGYQVKLRDELVMKGRGASVMLRSTSKDVLSYDAALGAITVQADIDVTGERALRISALNMQGASADGLSLSEMERFGARIQSETDWLANVQGQTQRLAPFDIRLEYRQEGAGKTVNITGNIDYDGFVPGGDVRGLKAGGTMVAALRGDDFQLGFSPKGKVHMQAFKSSSGWRGEDVVFSVESTENLFSKTKADGRMAAVLNAISARIVSPEDDRHMMASFDSLKLVSIVENDRQSWDISITGSNITSDNFPSPGTKISAQNSTVHMELAGNGDMSFSSHSPKISIETQNVRVDSMSIDIEGAPENFKASYAAKQVELVGEDYPVLPMRGSLYFRQGVLTGDATTDLPLTKDTPIQISFRSVNGQGEARILIPEIKFDPYGLQPQYLIPTLKGKLADVRGTVSAQFDFEFGGGLPIRSKGTTTVVDMDIGTMVGPLTGVNTKLVFSSMFPLKTEGVQVATLSGFDPGFPLERGAIQFEIVPEGVRIDEAIWPVGNIDAPDGKIYIAPMLWKFGNVKNKATVHVDNIELGTLLAKIGKEKFAATGQVSGTLPAIIDGVNMRIENGVLAIKDGGVIRFKTAGTDAAGMQNANAGYAFQALENFTYQKMEVRIDGPIDGDMNLDMLFDGHNPDVLGGQSFLFDVGVQGELANIVRNFSQSISNEEILKRIIHLQGDED